MGVETTDIILLSVPKLLTRGPLLSIAQLKACVQEAGFSCWTFDFNAWLFNNINESLHSIWDPLDSTFISDDSIITIKDDLIPLIDKFIIDFILPRNPKIIGLTVFSYWTFPMIKMFCQRLRKVSTAKILLGGPALINQQDNIDYLAKMKSLELYDDFISGDAEQSIVAYLNNEPWDGINTLTPNNNFDRETIPTPNYDDIDFSLYPDPLLYLNGSRGCVRKCAFCNVPLIWDKFSSKSGERMAEDMIAVSKRYNIHRFRFTDSLVNGNQKQFMNMVRRLSEYRKEQPKLSWSGQFIVRERDPGIEYFQLIADSGAENLNLGIESGSFDVRLSLGKNFSNQAIEYYLDGFSKAGMKHIIPLMFVGFPTENENDFQQSIDLLDTFAKYSCVPRISCEHPMLVIPGTPVHINMEEYGIHHYEDYFRWESKDNDYKTRIERFYVFIDKARSLGLYPGFVIGNSISIAEDYKSFPEVDPNILKIIESFHNAS